MGILLDIPTLSPIILACFLVSWPKLQHSEPGPILGQTMMSGPRGSISTLLQCGPGNERTAFFNGDTAGFTITIPQYLLARARKQKNISMFLWEYCWIFQQYPQQLLKKKRTFRKMPIWHLAKSPLLRILSYRTD
jgi:hypothetical protein